MKYSIHIIVFFLQINISFACLNGETKILKNGVKLYYVDHEMKSIPEGFEFFKIDVEKIKKDLQSEYNKTKDLDYLSDIGYILILQKKYDEALSLYLDIENKKPDRYSTASNLGTLYELIGDNVNALKWIEKSFKINSKFHNGSEWIHINILKAKIKAKAISSDDLIEANFGYENYPETDLDSMDLYNLKRQVYFQLNERISFIKPKDKTIGILLFDLANINYLLEAKPKIYLTLYKMAEEYGFDKKFVEARINAIKIKTKKTPRNVEKEKFDINKYQNTFLLILGLFLVIFLIFKLRK